MPCSLACNGQQGIDRAREVSPFVVVLDLYLKDPSGIEVLHLLREQGYKGKVILLAGMSVSPSIPEALRLGVDQVMGGGLSLGSVEWAIQSLLEPVSSVYDPELVKTQPHTSDDSERIHKVE